MTNYAAALAVQFHLKEQQTAKLIELIDAGNTIPFIARYRKEQHGSMDDTALRKLEDRLTYLRNLEQRRQEARTDCADWRTWSLSAWLASRGGA